MLWNNRINNTRKDMQKDFVPNYFRPRIFIFKLLLLPFILAFIPIVIYEITGCVLFIKSISVIYSLLSILIKIIEMTDLNKLFYGYYLSGNNKNTIDKLFYKDMSISLLSYILAISVIIINIYL